MPNSTSQSLIVCDSCFADWKVYGPDLNGRFGGLQGTGGLEAVILDADGTTTGVINDQFGNGVATVTGTGSGASVTWNTTRVGAYGPLPGIQAQTLTDVSQVAAATAWRSHRIDPTGFYWLGARYYEPTSGRFLSADPMGHVASRSLYDFCLGDPVNSFDPDGRWNLWNPLTYGSPNVRGQNPWNPVDSSAEWKATAVGGAQGAAAYADGILSLANQHPFANAGCYDPNDPYLKLSRQIGTAVGATELTLPLGAGAGALIEGANLGVIRTTASYVLANTVIGGTGNLASQLAENGWDLSNLNTQQLINAGIVGGSFGGISAGVTLFGRLDSEIDAMINLMSLENGTAASAGELSQLLKEIDSGMMPFVGATSEEILDEMFGETNRRHCPSS
jgi:RHS repeat-associated protein